MTAPNVLNVTASTTTNNGDIVLADATLGALTVTLPDASSGAQITIKKIDTTTNTVTVVAANGELVNGSASYVMKAAGEIEQWVTDGLKWHTITPSNTYLASPSQTGLYSARPAATTVAAGTTYVASDVLETYRSDGTSWTVVGSGNELAYTKTSTQFDTTTTSAFAAVAGISIAITAGERPVRIAFGAPAVNCSATSNINLSIYDVTGTPTEICRTTWTPPTTTAYSGMGAEIELTNLTPGSAYSYQVYYNVGGTAHLKAPASGQPAVWIRATSV